MKIWASNFCLIVKRNSSARAAILSLCLLNDVRETIDRFENLICYICFWSLVNPWPFSPGSFILATPRPKLNTGGMDPTCNIQGIWAQIIRIANRINPRCGGIFAIIGVSTGQCHIYSSHSIPSHDRMTADPIQSLKLIWSHPIPTQLHQSFSIPP